MTPYTLFFSLIISKIWFFAVTAADPSEVIIKSPRVTKWGEWGAMHVCPNGSYVSGMQIKVQEKQGTEIDDTSANGIRLHCSDFHLRSTAESQNRPYKEVAKTISSTVGALGQWSSNVSCDDAGFVVGFKLQVEKDQGKADDTSVNDIKVLCAQYDRPLWLEKTDPRGKNWGNWGDWGDAQICPPLMAVCGIQSQVDEYSNDATGLNNVDMKCCSLPAETSALQSCSPTFKENKLQPWSTFQKDAIVVLNFTHSMEWHYEGSIATEFTDLPIAVPDMPEKLIGIFAKDPKGNVWNRKRERMRVNSEMKSISVGVQAGQETKIWQPVGYCGWLSLSDNCIVKVVKVGKTERVSTLCSGSGSAVVPNGLQRQKNELKISLFLVVVYILY